MPNCIVRQYFKFKKGLYYQVTYNAYRDGTTSAFFSGFKTCTRSPERVLTALLVIDRAENFPMTLATLPPLHLMTLLSQTQIMKPNKDGCQFTTSNLITYKYFCLMSIIPDHLSELVKLSRLLNLNICNKYLKKCLLQN